MSPRWIEQASSKHVKLFKLLLVLSRGKSSCLGFNFLCPCSSSLPRLHCTGKASPSPPLTQLLLAFSMAVMGKGKSGKFLFV